MYNNSKTDEEDQVNEVYDEFLKDLEQRLFDLLGMEKPSPLTTEYNDFGELDNLEVLFLNSVWQDKEFERVVLTDFMWGAFSVISVWIYMLIHLGSVFLSVVGILEIFLSFPVALFFYRLVFQIKFFSEVNLLVVFILLGIGADDIFVFTDAYKQSANVPGVDPSLQVNSIRFNAFQNVFVGEIDVYLRSCIKSRLCDILHDNGSFLCHSGDAFDANAGFWYICRFMHRLLILDQYHDDATCVGAICWIHAIHFKMVVSLLSSKSSPGMGQQILPLLYVLSCRDRRNVLHAHCRSE